MAGLLLHDHCSACGERVVRSTDDPTIWRHAYVFRAHSASLCTDRDPEHGHTADSDPHPNPVVDLTSGRSLSELPAIDSVL